MEIDPNPNPEYPPGMAPPDWNPDPELPTFPGGAPGDAGRDEGQEL